MKKLNNKGFTLVELLAVIAILIIIMTVALPNISSAIERTKNKQSDSVKKIIITAGNLYVSDHKNKFSATRDYCIKVDTLIGEDYIDSEDVDSFTEKCLIYQRTGTKIKIKTEDVVSCSCGSGYTY